MRYGALGNLLRTLETGKSRRVSAGAVLLETSICHSALAVEAGDFRAWGAIDHKI
jgi:hypothetical protein